MQDEPNLLLGEERRHRHAGRQRERGGSDVPKSDVSIMIPKLTQGQAPRLLAALCLGCLVKWPALQK